MSELVQVSFDYSALSPEQAQRTQDAEYRLIGRTQKTIIENGRDLLAVKQDIGHGHFLNWTRSIGVSEDMAERWMSVAGNMKEIPHGAEFENRALYLLSTKRVPESARQEAKERAESGEKITEELAKQIRDAHKAKEEAEKKAESSQQQLTLFSKLSQDKITELTGQIATLQEQVETISKPEAIEVIPRETLDQIENLQSRIAELIGQKKVISDEAKKLADNLNTLRESTQAQRDQERYVAEVKSAWRKANEAIYKALAQFVSQLPSSMDLHLFDGDEWSRYALTEKALIDALSRHQQLKSARYGQVVSDVYEASLVEAVL